MARRNVSLWTLGCLFTVLALPVPAAADPVSITSGQLVWNGQTGRMDRAGERGFLLVNGLVDASGETSNLIDQCIVGVLTPDCLPGVVVDISAGWVGLDIRGGTVTFEGETHRMGIDSATVDARFFGSFIAPPRAAAATVTTPFRFAGSFDFPFPSPVSHSLTGSGTATINLSFSSFNDEGCVDAWRLDSVRYDFSPVPEPGTMLMVSLGIAGMARQ